MIVALLTGAADVSGVASVASLAAVGFSLDPPWPRMVAVVGAYVVTLFTSGLVVKAALRWTKHDAPMSDEKTARSGLLIGKCENILVVTLVFLEAFTAMALIFTAKSLVRREQVDDAEYLLGGTLVNVTWSLLVALAARWVVLHVV